MIRLGRLGVLLAIVALSAASGCGGSTPIRAKTEADTNPPADVPTALGSCPSGAKYSLAPASLQLGSAATSWYEAKQLSVVDGNLTIETDLETFRRGKSPFSAKDRGLTAGEPIPLAENAARRLSTAGVAPKSAVIGTDVRPNGETFIKTFGLIQDEGSVMFVGDCEYETVTLPLRSFAAQRRQPQIQVLREILGSPQGELATEFFAFAEGRSETAWSDLPPSQRSVSPEETPSDVLRSLKSQAAVITAPVAWSEAGWVVCARSSVGWGECSELTPSAATSSTDSTVTVHVGAYFAPGSGYDLVLKKREADYGGPTVALTTVNSAQAQDAGPVLVEASGDALRPQVISQKVDNGLFGFQWGDGGE